MPITKSAEKELRVAGRRELRSKSIRSLCKTEITKAEKLISSGDLESAQKATTVAVSALDKAAGKGTLHSGNAARRKSRLVKKLNQAKGSATKKTTEAKK